MLATESNNDDTDGGCFMSSFFWVAEEGRANGNLVLLLPCMVNYQVAQKKQDQETQCRSSHFNCADPVV